MFEDMGTGALLGAAVAAIALLLLAFIRKPVKCAACGKEQPRFRVPKTGAQAALGGYTCAGCGAELDAKGQVRGKKG